MSVQIYKPNKNNSGCGFSFSMGYDKNNKEPIVFVSAILQYSWDSKSSRGTFMGNKEDAEKNITVKLNEFECGSIISAIKSRHEWNTFHQTSDTKTTIKFSPWDKEASIKSYDSKTKEYKTKKQIVPAFGLSISRANGNTFKMPLEPGELECLSSFLDLVLQKIYSHRINKITQSFNEDIEPFDD